jgi:hypothetical protein
MDTNLQQIFFNLAKTAENQWHLPAQVQLNTATLNARTSITPGFTSPMNETVTAIAAITKSATTSTTDTSQRSRPNQGGSLSAVVEGTSIWNVSPIQDPEALKRLQLLYQYGTGKITAADLTCDYPIPRKPQGQKSDLQTLADALAKVDTRPSRGPKAPAKVDAPHRGKAPKAPETPEAVKKEKVYLVGTDREFCSNIALSSPKVRKAPDYTAAAQNNPDLAFLTLPTCVLCAYPNKDFNDNVTGYVFFTDKLKKKRYVGNISIDYVSDVPLELNPNKKYEFIPVVLNDALAPDKRDRSHPDAFDYGATIDWLYVKRDGLEAVPVDKRAKARLVGSAMGYSIYTTDTRKFSEFVIAIREAILQNPQVAKGGTAKPDVVSTVTGQ